MLQKEPREVVPGFLPTPTGGGGTPTHLHPPPQGGMVKRSPRDKAAKVFVRGGDWSLEVVFCHSEIRQQTRNTSRPARINPKERY